MVTIVVLGVSSIGVIQSNLNKRKIKCACLGDVFNLPMSTVTIVEDVSMVAMAGFMLAYGIYIHRSNSTIVVSEIELRTKNIESRKPSFLKSNSKSVQFAPS